MPHKKGKEAKTERATWFAMILVFALLRFDTGLSTLPEYVIPFTIAGILLISGVYQISQKWPVSPFTWGFAFILIILGIATFYYNLPGDMRLFSFAITVAHIIIGIVSNES
jgi:hypothetical protein